VIALTRREGGGVPTPHFAKRPASIGVAHDVAAASDDRRTSRGRDIGIGRVESQMPARRAKDREGHNHKADECGEDEDDLRTMTTGTPLALPAALALGRFFLRVYASVRLRV